MIAIEAELALVGARSGAHVGIVPLASFRQETLTAWTRLSWQGGTCNVGSVIAYWGNRFAAVVCDGVAIIDAVHGHHARLELDVPGASTLTVQGGWLRVGMPTSILSLPLVALERLAETPGPVEIRAHLTYPNRRPTACEPATVAWLYDNNDAVVNVMQRQIWLDAKPYGLTRTMKFTLCDELWPGEFVTIDVPGQPLRTLRSVETERVLPARVVLGLPPHPLRHQIQPDTLRRDRVIPFLERLAEDPDDDTTRSILLDLLQEQGVPYARTIAEARTGKRTQGWALTPTLGPLTHVFHTVEWRSGLPWSARLLPRLPDDEALLELIGGDIRLGMLRAIYRDNCAMVSYARVLAMPLAIGVRRIDSCGPELLERLIEARRDRLHAMRGVLLAKQRTQRLLADPTFDRVREVEGTVTPNNLDHVLDTLVSDEEGWLARTPRRISLVPETNTLVLPIEPVLTRWRRLPVLELAMSGVTLERDHVGGAPSRARLATTAKLGMREALKRLLPEVPITPPLL